MNRNAFGLTDRDMNTVEDIFRKYPDIQTVVIFGSRAKGTYKHGSDIDLAVMDQGITDTLIRNIQSEFEDSSLPYFVDLINYHNLTHSDLKNHIDRIGVPFYQVNHGK